MFHLILISLIGLSFGCRDAKNLATVSEEANQIQSENKTFGDVFRKIELPVSIRRGMSLTTEVNATRISVLGCASGLSVDDTAVVDSLELYLHDVSCQAKLESFEVNGSLFLLNGSFNPEVQGHSFYLNDSGNIAVITVESQLSSPIQLGDTISFSMEVLDKGADQVLNGIANVVIVEADLTSIAEESGVATFRVRKLTELNSSALSVLIAVSGNTTEGSDYMAPPTSVTIPAGEKTAQFSITLVDDAIAEAAEIIQVKALPSANYFTYGKAQTMITDSDTGFVSTGQIMRFNSSSVSLTGNLVNTWTDLSGKGNHATQTSTARPALIASAMNGHDAIFYDGSNDMLKIADSTDINTGGPYQEKTVILAIKTSDEIARRQLVYEQGGSVRGLSIYIENDQLYCNAWNANADDATTPWSQKFVSTAIQTSTNYVVGLRLSKIKGTLECYVNAAFVGSVSGIGNLFAHTDDIGLGGPNGNTLFLDGSSTVTGTYFKGYIAEFLAYNSGFSDTDFSGTLDYLSRKYGYTQPAVSLSVSVASVGEQLGINPVLTAYRNDLNSEELVVSYQVGGTASPSADYKPMQGQIVIPAFSASASETITIYDDVIAEDLETITVSINPMANYIVTGSGIQVDIIDNENFQPHGQVSLWLKASENLVRNGSYVSGWGDSVAIQSVSQSSATSQPLWVAGGLNGKDTISFDGSNDFFSVGNSASTNIGGPYSGKTFAFVMKTSSDVSQTQMLYEQGGASRGMNFYLENGNLYFNTYNFPNDDGGVTTPWGQTYVNIQVQPDTSYLVLGEWDATLNLIRLTLNGQTATDSGLGLLYNHSGAIAIGAVDASTVLHDGRNIASGDFYKGSLSELVFYNEAIPATERTALLQYLTQKYGLQ